MKRLLSALARGWRKIEESAPRQLRFTRAGRFLTGIALLTGFAAINTGNNLLFLGWGLVLSAIALSGVLSEAVLRSVVLEVRSPGVGRAGEAVFVPLLVRNTSRRMPVFALESRVSLRRDTVEVDAVAPYLLRLSPGESTDVVARLVPTSRGRFSVTHAAARTAYPFGFFEKSRRFLQARECHILVGPRRLDASLWARALLTRAGEGSVAKPGPGDELYGLKPFRQGDDPRRIHWRKSLASARLIAKEPALELGSELTVEVRLAPVEREEGAVAEHTLAVACSTAEALLEQGLRVGLVAPGVYVPPDHGASQSSRIVQAFARLDVTQPAPRVSFTHPSGRVIVASAGAEVFGAERYLRVGAQHVEVCERGAA